MGDVLSVIPAAESDLLDYIDGDAAPRAATVMLHTGVFFAC